MGSAQQPSIGSLISRTVGNVRALATAQVDLTKAEMSANVSRVQGITVLGIVVIAMLLQASLMLTFAIVYALVQFGLPTWASFLIVAGVFLLVAAIAGAMAYSKAQGFRGPDVAKVELEKTVEAVKALGNPAPSPSRTS
jgi:uncharacterized membrane protein YqjE